MCGCLLDYLQEQTKNQDKKKKKQVRNDTYSVFLDGVFYKDFIDRAHADRHIKTYKFYQQAKNKLIHIKKNEPSIDKEV